MAPYMRFGRPSHGAGRQLEVIGWVLLTVTAASGVYLSFVFGRYDAGLIAGYLVATMVACAWCYGLVRLGTVLRWLEFKHEEGG